jgi:methionyl-tRNA formyltransferase
MSRAIFIGSKALGLSVLRTMLAVDRESVVSVQTVDDSDDSRTKLVQFEALCGRHGVPLFIVGSSKASEVSLSCLEFDVGIVCGWYWILSDEALAQASLGYYGIHNSKLPSYRGSAPVVWAMLQGDWAVGATLYKLEKEVDTGDIYGTARVEIGWEDYIGEVLRRLSIDVCAMVAKAYPKLLAGTAEHEPQSSEWHSYGCKRTPADGKIDWSAPARDIYDEIRAQSRPYPGAWTDRQKGGRIHLWRSELAPYPVYGSPGQVFSMKNNHLGVVCGDGSLVITDWTSDGVNKVRVNDRLG